MKINFGKGNVAIIPHKDARSREQTEKLCEDMKALLFRPATFKNHIIGEYMTS